VKLWQFYEGAWEAERALKAVVPTAWLVARWHLSGFPPGAEPGGRWVKSSRHSRRGSSPMGCPAWTSRAGFTVIACQQHAEVLGGVEEAHVVLNTDPAVGLRLHEGGR